MLKRETALPATSRLNNRLVQRQPMTRFSIFSLCCLILVLCSNPSAHADAPKSFAADTAVIDFANAMTDRHGFDAAELLGDFARLQPNPTVLKLIAPPASPTQRSWQRYRTRFLNPARIDEGLRFWQEHQVTLRRASAEYGVPEEIIVAIIGVETVYGRNQGRFGVMEALATLAFAYPPRAEFFRRELEQFLLLARENRVERLAVLGSYAGAIGIPQFMPGSQRRYAVDYDGDGRIDLSGSVEDAIGSVARFLERHGWQRGEPVAVPASIDQKPARALLDAGIRPSLKAADLASQDIRGNAPADAMVTLIDLVTPEEESEYWLGFENFYVITRYNRSSFYAMAVFQPAEAIRAKTGQ